MLLCSLLFVFLSGLFLSAAALGADGPPPLPRPNTKSGELEGLSALLSGTGNAGSKVKNPSSPSPVQHIQAEYEEILPPKPLSSPASVNQASFTTFPTRQFAEESAREELSPESVEDSEEALTGVHHEVLAKPLSFKKLTKREFTDTEEGEGETKIGGWKNKLAKPELAPLFSVGGSLFVVIAAFFLLAALLRKVSPKGNRPLPTEAFECLGRYHLTQKHPLQVLRMGNRIVLVSVMPDGVSTLAEITDPDEVVSFLGLCRRFDSNSATAMSRKIAASMSEEELSRPSRPTVTARRQVQSTGSLDLYSDPDESLAAILARGRR